MEPIDSGPMAGRTVLVTGGTGGTGRATALVYWLVYWEQFRGGGEGAVLAAALTASCR